MQHSYSSTSQTIQPVQQKSLSQADIIGNTVAGVLVIVLPTCLVLGALLYRKHHRIHRATVRLQQIAMLERLWQISPRK